MKGPTMPCLRLTLAAALAALALLTGMPPVSAQGPASGREHEPANREHPQSPGEPALPADAVTAHSIKIGTQELAYGATAGSLAITNDKGDRTAEVFYVAYILNGADPKTRPLTIVFNGGPGAGAAYLQLGALGPRVLDFGNGREPPFATGGVVDNADTWLDMTDLVFIDPVGAGYSRGIGSEDETRKAFWGVHQDLVSLGQIIRLALGKLDRFASPLYLVGESYGGFRAARLPKFLAQDQGLVVRGAVLVSPALELSLLLNDDILAPMPWALRIPSYAAVDLEGKGTLTPEALQPVERFALGDYLHNIVVLPTDPQDAQRFYATLAQMIGLPEPLVARWKGRVPLPIFIKEKRHDQGELLSRYDGSVETLDPYPWSGWPNSGDPILSGLTAPLTNAFVAYVRDELHFKTDRRYILLNGEVAEHWNMHEHDSGTGPVGGASDDLSEGLALEPRLRVLIAHGMTDLQTPYLTSRYVIDHIPTDLTQGRVALKLYPGGHMMYLRPASRTALHKDARAIYGIE
jgi:carboxypeptidase C (cathepsin A)